MIKASLSLLRSDFTSLFLYFLALAIVFGIALIKTNPVESAIALNLVISEIKVAGVSDVDDEFIELYNPTSSPVNLAGWRVTRMTSTGTESNLIASMSGTIPAHGFFLLANDESPASPSADLIYASAVAANNTINLYSDAGNTLIDRVGFGTASIFESTPAAQPSAGQSLERKANSASTVESMTSGIDVLEGNGEDTDNNGNDFIIRTSPDPQNSLSQIEPIFSTPSATPTSTASATPSSTPSSSPSATPSSTPSASPTASPSASPTATPSAKPSSMFPNVFPFVSSFYSLSCTTSRITIGSGLFSFSYPKISCKVNRL